ncbi:MAG: hypothetical protein Q7S40_12270 [Opitutaceae bacterium]|nr:hypothetical protein [Opitutaceae bacterium]
MNVHPDGHAPFVDERTIVQRNVDSLRELVSFMTLEVFARDRHFLAYSRDRLRQIWNAAA